MKKSSGDDNVKARDAGVRLTPGNGTKFDVRTFAPVQARGANGVDDFAEILERNYEFELEVDRDN